MYFKQKTKQQHGRKTCLRGKTFTDEFIRAPLINSQKLRLLNLSLCISIFIFSAEKIWCQREIKNLALRKAGKHVLLIHIDAI